MFGAIAGALNVGSGLFNAYTNYKNYQLQKDNYRYQKWLQNQIFMREDTSVQRRVADLRAAGLSPTLAAGSSASAGAVVPTKAPEREGIDLKASESAQLIMSMMQMKKNFEQTDAQIKLLQSQKLKADIDIKQKWHDYQIYDDWGQPSNTSGLPKTIMSIAEMMQSRSTGGVVDQIKNKLPASNKSTNKALNKQENAVNKYLFPQLKKMPDRQREEYLKGKPNTAKKYYEWANSLNN